MSSFKNGFAIDDNLVTFDGYHLTGIFVNKVFYPGFQNTSSKFLPDNLLQVCLIYFYFFGKIEYF